MDAGAVGIGLRAPHYAELLERRPALGFLEVHSENYFGDGGAPLAWLERFRALYPLSFHGVGLSLGSADPLDTTHLARLKALVRRFEPALVSEHLSWSSFGGRHANDLLPLPLTEEAIEHVAGRVRKAQDYLGRELLVENISAYVRLGVSAMPEWEFVAAVAARAGCRLLLDVNNVWVNAVNHGFDAQRYLEAIAPQSVAELHLGGFERTPQVLVDTHGATVSEEVWDLYAKALSRFGRRPTLIEWDTDLPALDVLLAEAARARGIGP
jgi:uncharacterized protein (UPF0276 family)